MKDKILTFLKTKGYYLVLGLCILTVGGVSFLSYRASQKELSETPLDQPNTQNVEKVEENVTDQREEAAQTPQEAAPQATAAVYSKPIENGEIITQFSPEKPL